MRSGARNKGEDGVVLVQVLGVLAFASAVAFIMLSLQDQAIAVRQRSSDLQQARILAQAGETSVLTAFRRDGRIEPELDHYGEGWSVIAQQPVDTRFGTFSVNVEDANARYNINNLVSGSLSESAAFRRLMADLGFEESAALQVEIWLRANGEIADISDLTSAGLMPEAIDRLNTFVTAIPGQSRINLNTVDERLLQSLVANPGITYALIAARERNGFLTPEGLAEAGALMPQGFGLTTDALFVETDVRVGDGRSRLKSLLVRDIEDDTVTVRVVSRDHDG